MNKPLERIFNGLVKENPTFVLMLGMCPTLAVTTSAINGLGMGISTMVVLIMSNLMISALRKIIPDGVRMPAYIVVVASFVTIVEMLMHAYVTPLYDSLGVYIPLIVVNCIILGRAEAYASKNPVIPSIFDGVGMGLGFTVALTILGMIRELFGAGTLFGMQIMPEAFTPVSILVLAPGAFLVMAVLTALQNKFKAPSATNIKGDDIACGGNCAGCTGRACGANHMAIAEQKAKEALELQEKLKAERAAKPAAKAEADAAKKEGKTE